MWYIVYLDENIDVSHTCIHGYLLNGIELCEFVSYRYCIMV